MFPNELRKVDKYIVYEHWLNNEVVYIEEIQNIRI